jgi:uncharacterized membrane protein YidH (DUF202 family)
MLEDKRAQDHHPRALLMLLLILPLLLVFLLAVGLVLVPLSLWQRYRYGHKRRRAFGWLVQLNAWMLLLTLPGFLAAAWLGSVWSEDALRDAAIGLLAGGLLGFLGLWLTRFERLQGALHYTPNRWLVLALTLLVALRIVLGFWWTWHRCPGCQVSRSSCPRWHSDSCRSSPVSTTCHRRSGRRDTGPCWNPG